MKLFLSIMWYIASILIIYLSVIGTKKYKFKQFNIRGIINSLKSKSKNNISPIASLMISLAAKVGVGSLSGVAIAIYFGGIGTIFWIIVIGIFTAINGYIECILGIKYRIKINNNYIGGPSYYIKSSLGNKYLSILYSILIIISYGVFFLSIQVNTIIKTTKYFNINSYIVILLLVIITILIIRKGIALIAKINNKLVPLMLVFYFLIGIYILINYYRLLPSIIVNVIREAFNIRSIIPVFLIGMQRAIFMTESSIGTSAISASSCDNESNSQGLLEILGIYIIIFIVCFTTFLLIVTSNYMDINFNNINGIELVLYSFNYHFGNIGSILLGIIVILFAFSTIISSYYFGDTNIYNLANKNGINIIYKIVFILVIVLSSFISPKILWNLTDYFVALLVIINVYAILKIITKTTD